MRTNWKYCHAMRHACSSHLLLCNNGQTVKNARVCALRQSGSLLFAAQENSKPLRFTEHHMNATYGLTQSPIHWVLVFCSGARDFSKGSIV
jgi:hypothetical protein